jgi:hypothetical protein
MEGIAKAKAAGKYKGRKPSVDTEAIQALHAEGVGPSEIAKRLGSAGLPCTGRLVVAFRRTLGRILRLWQGGGVNNPSYPRWTHGKRDTGRRDFIAITGACVLTTPVRLRAPHAFCKAKRGIPSKASQATIVS